MQMICALLVLQTPDLPAPLDLLSPWLDMQTRSVDDVFAALDAQDHRRFIKTHTPLDGLPWHDRVTYICVGRDPRDVALSIDNHWRNMDQEAVLAARREAVGLDDLADASSMQGTSASSEVRERFWAWVDDDRPATMAGSSLRRVVEHLGGFWEIRDRPNVVMVHYDDLKADLEGSMRRLAVELCIHVPEQRWPALVEAATFESMRAAADERAPDTTHAIWKDNTQFFHRGTSGQWHEVMTSATDLDRYRARVTTLARPDLLTWMHSSTSA
jgi:hypothetical protein